MKCPITHLFCSSNLQAPFERFDAEAEYAPPGFKVSMPSPLHGKGIRTRKEEVRLSRLCPFQGLALQGSVCTLCQRICLRAFFGDCLYKFGDSFITKVTPECSQASVGSSSSGRVSSKFGAFVSSVHSFDAPAFSIPSTEAAVMDPQTRVLLEESAHAFIDSGRVPCAFQTAQGGTREHALIFDLETKDVCLICVKKLAYKIK
eukprot:1157087-Pelagomonas_calceolata.AAC.10